MVDIDQYILLFLEQKKKEIEEFKDYIKTSTLPDRIIPHNEWKSIYLNWSYSQENNVEKTRKMPKIYLNDD
jgi:hypothetical protein